MIKKLTKTKIYLDIKKDLINQLKLKNADTPVFLDLVEDYLSMWSSKEMLNKDIETRGVVIKYDNGGGQSGLKSNDSVDKQYKVNSQMLKLLSELGIKSDKVSCSIDDEL